MPPARRSAGPTSEELLSHLDQVVRRLERLGDRLEAYIEADEDACPPEEGPDEHPAPAP